MFHMTTGRVTSNLLSRKAMTNSSQDSVKEMKKAASRVGHSIGTVTRRSACRSLAPRSWAARSIFA